MHLNMIMNISMKCCWLLLYRFLFKWLIKNISLDYLLFVKSVAKVKKVSDRIIM